MAGTFDEFRIFAAYRSAPTGPFVHIDPLKVLNFPRDIITDQAHIFYANELGKFPFAGPHQILNDKNWMDDHKLAITNGVETGIPDSDFDGLAIIDYERWHVLFDWEEYKTDHGFFYDSGFDEFEACKNENLFDVRDKDFREDFYNWWYCSDKDKIQSLLDEGQDILDEFMRKSWNDITKKFYEVTIEECKKLRPKAKWGFFGYPRTIYQDTNLTAAGPGVFGYGRSNRISEVNIAENNGQILNDSMSWLYNIEDIMIPSIYCPRFTVDIIDIPDSSKLENSIFHDKEFLRSNCREFNRIANDLGKDFMCVIWNLYDVENKAPYHLSELNDTNWKHQIKIPFEEGAFGIVLWSSLFLPNQDAVMNEQYNTISPIIREIL